jgi:hypothetical protein
MENANVEQRLIGTWKPLFNEKVTWVFKTNGTLTIVNNYRFVVVDTKLVTAKEGSSNVDIYDILMPSDGKTLILNNLGSSGGIWLTKQ